MEELPVDDRELSSSLVLYLEVVRVDTVFHQPDRVAIAHRGSRLLWPENTMVAFEGAASHGYNFFETDLRVTSDGILVCFHDPLLDRTTNGHGLVSSRSSADLARLDAGHRHRVEGGFPFRGAGVGVPTLVDVVRRFPGSGWVVDLKADGTEAPLARLIENEGLYERVIVGSFSEVRLARFRDLTGGRVATSTGPGETLRTVLAAGLGRSADPFGSMTTALQVPVTWYGLPVVMSRLIEFAHRRGRLIHVWTVNEPVEMTRLSELGVDGLITDRADLLAP